MKIEILGSKEGGGPWDDGAYSTIRRLLIYHGQWICSLHVEYDKNGHSIWGSKHGGNEGSLSEVLPSLSLNRHCLNNCLVLLILLEPLMIAGYVRLPI